MARAFKCDACGILYESRMAISGAVHIVIDHHPYPDTMIADLCPKCQKKLEDFVHYNEKKENQNAID